MYPHTFTYNISTVLDVHHLPVLLSISLVQVLAEADVVEPVPLQYSAECYHTTRFHTRIF